MKPSELYFCSDKLVNSYDDEGLTLTPSFISRFFFETGNYDHSDPPFYAF